MDSGVLWFSPETHAVFSVPMAEANSLPGVLDQGPGDSREVLARYILKKLKDLKAPIQASC